MGEALEVLAVGLGQMSGVQFEFRIILNNDNLITIIRNDVWKL